MFGTHTYGHRHPAHASHESLPLLVSALAALAVGVGVAWLAWPRATEQPAAPQATSVLHPAVGDLVLRSEVAALQRRLVRNGYEIAVTGVFDPVTKAAAADFLRASDLRALPVPLAVALNGTVVTGRRAPTAWNARFGVSRRSTVVDRALTGADGQLDTNGNRR